MSMAIHYTTCMKRGGAGCFQIRNSAFSSRELLCGRCGGTVVMELCAFWLYESCVVFVGLLVGFRWTSGGQPTPD